MKIAIGSDKSGFVLKNAIANYLSEEGIAFDDLGTTDLSNGQPYFAVASAVAPRVATGEYSKAILICGTGMGMSVVANKFQGVYAAACESVYAAKMCRAINDANVLCMGGWVLGPEMALAMTKVFLSTDFLQDLEPWRQTFLTNAKAQVIKIENDVYDK